MGGTTEATAVSSAREPELLGQTVVRIGGSAGIGLETARRARSEGADVILTGRNPERLKQAALDVDARSTAAFDANDAADAVRDGRRTHDALKQFFDGLPDPIDHVLVTAGGPHYAPLLEMDAADVRDALSDDVVLGLEVARNARGKMRPGGTLLLMGGTGGRKISRDLGIMSAATAVLPPFTAALALALAPVRVNLIAAGFVDTPLSASLLGDGLEARRDELRTTLPIGRVVGPADVAALAVHIMINTALTGATYDIDGASNRRITTGPAASTRAPAPCALRKPGCLVLPTPLARRVPMQGRALGRRVVLLLLISAGLSRRMPRSPSAWTDSRTGTAEGRACR